MNRGKKMKMILAAMAVATLLQISPAGAAEDVSDLMLKPCTIELVDGTEVEGHLAVQFDMPDHLIVYSPRLATVRSFLKEHVHAVTVDGERRKLNPKREFSDEDRKLLGRVDWPEEPPEKGRKPAYTTETWDKPRQLLVWARPGKSGRFGDPDNWLVNGEVRTLDATEIWTGPSWGRSRGVTALNRNTDLLIPAAASDYQVRGRDGTYIARHITIESCASFSHGLQGAYGNLWIDENGHIDGGGCAFIRGAKHSFYVNGKPYTGDPPKTPEEFSRMMKSAKYFARKWVIRKDDVEASVTMIGTFRSGDETHWLRGVTILEKNGVFSIGGRTTQTIEKEARVVLKSGAVFGKNGNQLYKDDLRLKGALLVGTPDEPITRNVYLGLSIKDPKGTYPKSDKAPNWSDFRLRGTSASSHGYGLVVAPGAEMAVHIAKPDEAKLVITWHGITDQGSDDGTTGGYFDEIAESERTTNMLFLDDVQLNDVVLDWFGEGDIRMFNPAVRNSWKRVSFGKHCIAGENEIFRKLSFNAEVSKKLAEYRDQLGTTAGFFVGGTLFSKNPGTPTVKTPDGYYPKGETVTVRLFNETKDVETRYTLDGTEPTADSPLYEAPFTVSEDVVVKAAGFKDGKQLGETAEARFRFIKPEEVEMIESVEPGETSEGLTYAFFEGGGESMPDFDSLKPAETGVAWELSIESVGHRGDKFSLLLEGYLQIDEPGAYNVHIDTAKADVCRIYIDGRRIVDNGMEELESVALAGLDRGKHKLRIEFLDNGWGEIICMALRKLEDSRKRTITADMLSH